MFELSGKYAKAKIMIDEIDKGCEDQILSFLNHLAFMDGVISIMPDTHKGTGAAIGFTMKLGPWLIPNVVGVDVNCGMYSLNVGKKYIFRKINWRKLDDLIRRMVPFGKNVHQDSVINMETDFSWKEANDLAEKFAARYEEEYGVKIIPPKYDYEWFKDKCRAIGVAVDYAERSIGTLGGGNHFIEIGQSEMTGDFWITIHTGSRNFGARLANYHQSIALDSLIRKKEVELKEIIREIKETTDDRRLIERKIRDEKQRLGIVKDMKTDGLEWLEGDKAVDYLFDMVFAGVYSSLNRKYIAKIIIEATESEVIDEIETIHNYIDFNDFIIRKGAISSYEGQRMIIPFNMRDGILVCEGKSNAEWNFSAPHGAGRVYSRAEARRKIKIATVENQMQGIHTTGIDEAALEEAPDAYKNPAVIEAAIQPTAKVIDRLKVIHSMKEKKEDKKVIKKERA